MRKYSPVSAVPEADQEPPHRKVHYRKDVFYFSSGSTEEDHLN